MHHKYIFLLVPPGPGPFFGVRTKVTLIDASYPCSTLFWLAEGNVAVWFALHIFIHWDRTGVRIQSQNNKKDWTSKNNSVNKSAYHHFVWVYKECVIQFSGPQVFMCGRPLLKAGWERYQNCTFQFQNLLFDVIAWWFCMVSRREIKKTL